MIPRRLRYRLASAAINTITAGVTVTKGASGIAPLYCFFDAGASTSTQTALPWHEIRYYWDFGDGSAGTWGKGVDADSKNTDWGPMAGHVYETPGTYTPTCSMFDGVSITVWIGSPITVNSAVAPSDWAGRKTVLASTSSAFTCAGITTTGTVTLPIASPGVVGWTTHGRAVGDPVYFSNSGGALPTGLTAGTAYYIIAAGFGANSFQVSATFGGSAINFTGSQSGTHTAIGGAMLTSSSSYDTIMGLVQTAIAASPAGPARCLFRAGESFTATTTGNSVYIASASGPGVMGTYNSSGPAPGSSATIAAAAAFPATGLLSMGSTSAGYSGQNDWRVMDLLLDCSAQADTVSSYGFTLNGTCNNLLVLRCPVKAASWLGFDFNYQRLNGVPYTTRGFTIQDNIGIVDCPQQNPRTTASLVLNSWGYVNGKRLFIAGNDMNANGSAQASSHNLRSFQFEKIVIAHNTFAQAGSGRHSIKLHSAEVIAWGANAGTGTGAFTPSSTSNGGLGDFRRPYNPVFKGLWAADTAPQVWRCTTSGLTSGTEPTWNLSAGSTTSDGAAVWTECSAGFYAGTTIPSDDCSIRGTTFGNERFYSSEALVRRNKFTGATSAWVMGVGPLDDDDYSLVYRAIVEENQFLNTGAVSRAINFWGREQTFRNNLMNLSGGVVLQYVYAGQRNSSTTAGYSCRKLWVYGNSGFCNATASGTLTFLAIDATAQDVVLKNNLFYTPGLGAKSPTISTGTGKPGNDLVSSNNTSSFTTAPGLATDPPVAVTDWKPSGGYSLNAGAAIPVWSDFAGTTRPNGAAQDIGAYEQ